MRLLRHWRPLILLAAALLFVARPGQAAGVPDPPPTPQLACDSQSLPETRTQGRVPKSEVDSGRAALGYRCNTVQVGRFGDSGGYRVERYIDAAGHECAYYDSTLLFPTNVRNNTQEGLGVYVLDMTNHAHPVHTATLSTPAMLSPHESLRLNQKRGLLAADMGYPSFNPGFVDVYSVAKDCRHPVLESSTPLGILGHESAFSPDGTVFYVSSTGGHTLDAVDLRNPRLPKILWGTTAYEAHGMSVSADGNRLYMADVGYHGLTILDVSRINAHQLNPAVPIVSRLTWPDVSIPQNAIPFTENGHHYLVEVDEYTNKTGQPPMPGQPLNFGYDANAKVGAARIIDIQDERHPFVVSNMRLSVNQTAERKGDEQNDYGAKSPVEGYAAHYCNVPTQVNPTYVACSFILSGLRVFNIKDIYHPFEMAYFNAPSTPPSPTYVGVNGGNFAMSSPTFDTKRNEIWYTDGFWGFYVVKLTPNAFASAVVAATTPGATTNSTPTPPSLPATGRPAGHAPSNPVTAFAAAVAMLFVLGLAYTRSAKQPPVVETAARSEP